MLGEQGIVSEVSRIEMKRRGRIKMEGTKTIFFCSNDAKTKTRLNQFKIFCTGSEKIVPKAKIELQHIFNGITSFPSCTMLCPEFVPPFQKQISRTYPRRGNSH